MQEFYEKIQKFLQQLMIKLQIITKHDTLMILGTFLFQHLKLSLSWNEKRIL